MAGWATLALQVTEEQRRTAIMQLPFFRDYFYDASVELLIESPPEVELEGQQRPHSCAGPPATVSDSSRM